MADRLKIAVLDDYQGVSKPHFEALDPSSYKVTVFKDTLLPYNHPATPLDEKDRLVKRLEPFAVICRPELVRLHPVAAPPTNSPQAP